MDDAERLARLEQLEREMREADDVKSWSAEEVIRRWIMAYPPKTAKGDEIEVTQAWIDHHAKAQGKLADLKASESGAVVGSRPAGEVEQDL